MEIAREDFLPTADYMNLPHISGHLRLSAPFKSLLMAGMAFVRRRHPLGHTVAMEALTNPQNNPDLALAFATYLKEHDAEAALTHEAKYTTMLHSNASPIHSKRPRQH